MKKRILFFLLLIVCSKAVFAIDENDFTKLFGTLIQDTIPTTDSTAITANNGLEMEEEEIADTVVHINHNPKSLLNGKDTVPIIVQNNLPIISVQQYIKGAAPGTYVIESNGEPGTNQQVFVRGLSRILGTPKDLYDAQATVYVDGIPLIQNNPFVYNIQRYTLNPIGTATNILSAYSIDNIESINVVKDYKDAAVDGPFAANGAIHIKTKQASQGLRKISINSYFGYVFSPEVNTLNANDEKNFRLPFYYLYNRVGDFETMPEYLSDSSNVNYYGPSNWTDLYYKNTPQYSINGSLTGGSARSNFRFFADYTKNANPADETKLDRYTGTFHINMLPTKWLTVSSMISASVLDRYRNKNFTDRFAEMRYLPSSTAPPSPNKDLYASYLYYNDISYDNNKNTAILGYWGVEARILKGLYYKARLSLDYNEDRRDVFWRSELFDGSNYVSNYFGFNERLFIESNLNYDYDFSNGNNLFVEGGLSYRNDIQRYNYGYAYNGPNDFTQINVVEGDQSRADYLVADGFTVWSFIDKMHQRMMSFYGRARYSFKKDLEVGAVVRSDGYSAMQPNSRWFVSPVFDATYHLGNRLQSSVVSDLDLNLSWGRLGNLRSDQNIGAGPQYSPQLGWANYPSIVSYNGYGTYSRPYNTGWVGYDIPWTYSDQINAGAEVSFFNRAVSVKADWYSKNSKNIIYASPVSAESGYSYSLTPGMVINNTGIDLTITGAVNTSQPKLLQWVGSLNLNYNKNKLKELADGAQSVIINDRKFEVGKPVDQFWLLHTNGIYGTDSEVPVNPATNEPMTYRGIPLEAGDARWTDVNDDYEIDDEDRQLKGNIFPRISGGMMNQLKYRKFDLSFQLYFALKRNILNQEASNYYDFINRESITSLDQIRNITYWEDRVDQNAYPMYNPWSLANPYQVNQDLFLEDASYLKLRSVTLGYEIKSHFLNGKLNRIYTYVTGTNLLTVSKYTGRDPELIDYTGYNTGYQLAQPRSIIVGVKLDF